MLHEEDKEIIRKFRYKADRRGLAKSIRLSLLYHKRNIPHRTAEALDILLSKLYEDYKNNKELKSAIIVTEGNCHLNIKPERDRIFLLGKRYYINRAKHNGIEKKILTIDVSVGVDDGKKIVFNFGDERERYHNHDLKYHKKYTNPQIYKNSKGVAIKKTTKGDIGLNGVRYNFGYSQKKRHIIAVFTDKDTYFFDLKGKMMFEAFDSKETNERRKMFKASEIEKKSKHFDPEEHCSKVIEGMKKWWANYPNLFLERGLTAIVEGCIEHTTTNGGNLDLCHYTEDEGKVQKKIHIPVGKDFPHEMVKVEFNGPYVIIYTADNKLLNAHILNPFVHREFRFTENNNLHTISIKEKNIKTEYTEIGIRENEKQYLYYFSRKNIEELTGSKLEDYARMAILIDKNKQEKPDFELLLIRKDNELLSKEIQPNGVYLLAKS